MTRNLKTFLGLGFVAVFAMSVFGASVAQATLKVTTSASPAVLTTSSIGNQKFTINPKQTEPANIACTGFSSHATAKNGDSTVVTTSTAYSGCTATIGANTLPVTIDPEGCEHIFHGGQATGTPDHFIHVTVDYECPEGITGMAITIFSDTEFKTRICKYTAWEYTNKGDITLITTTGSPDDVDLNAINVPVESTRNEGILCPKPKESAVYNGELTLRAFEDLGSSPLKEGSQIGVTFSE